MLEGDTALLHLGEESFAERLQQYLDLGDALRERVAEIDYVDLRFPERLYVRPAQRRGRRAGVRSRRGGRDGIGGSVAQRERYVVGLDIGTSKVCTVVGEMRGRRRPGRHRHRRRPSPRDSSAASS